jgi:hypothetical protein
VMGVGWWRWLGLALPPLKAYQRWLLPLRKRRLH